MFWRLFRGNVVLLNNTVFDLCDIFIWVVPLKDRIYFYLLYYYSILFYSNYYSASNKNYISSSPASNHFLYSVFTISSLLLRHGCHQNFPFQKHLFLSLHASLVFLRFPRQDLKLQTLLVTKWMINFSVLCLLQKSIRKNKFVLLTIHKRNFSSW